ncbi:MAG: NDP-sugar synthase [Actinomycetota bacterium]|nr:NDP-sugar synthase [Actinomycetota bacterium]
MQALVLAGGEGTRLRPLTLTVPKPVLPLCGRPFLCFMLDWLARHGVDDVLLSCGFMAEEVEEVLGSRYRTRSDGPAAEHRDMRLRYVVEDAPLGTAGPVKLAAASGLLADRLFVLNGDVLTDLDLSALLGWHAASGAAATLALVAVEDTASYGVVPTAADGRVEAFLEKAAGSSLGGRVNAGAYVLEREAVDRIPSGAPVSFEREVFPPLAEDGRLYGYPASDYWIDIGTPERYLEATGALLEGRLASDLPPPDQGGSLLYDGASAPEAEVGPLSVLGRRCTVGAGSAIRRSVLFDGVSVGARCTVEDSVLAEGVRLGDDVRVGPAAVVGSGAEVGSGTMVAPKSRIPPKERLP